MPLLINAFGEARLLETMDLDESADDAVAHLIRLVEQWMHGGILHKATKATKNKPKPSPSPSSPVCLQMLFVDARLMATTFESCSCAQRRRQRWQTLHRLLCP